MSDIRKIEVIATTHYKVDVSKWFEEFDSEWQDFLEGQEPNDSLREEFIRDTAQELGRDLEDWSFGVSFDTDYEVDFL